MQIRSIATKALKSIHARFGCGLATVIAAGSLLTLSGCPGAGPRDSVTGKVTLDSKPVEGTLSFFTADKKEFTGPIMFDGTYTVTGAPRGSVTVAIKGTGIAATQAPIGGGKKDLMKDLKAPSAPQSGVAPPAKYGSPETSGLTLEIKGGHQVQDFTLTP